MNTHITNGLDSIRDRYEDYHWFNNLENLDNLPTDEEYILSQVEQDSYLSESTNFFNLDRDNLKELYNLLIKHYENNYSDLFKSQLESSEHPTEHLKSTIQMSVDWQNIWQDYLKNTLIIMILKVYLAIHLSNLSAIYLWIVVRVVLCLQL